MAMRIVDDLSGEVLNRIPAAVDAGLVAAARVYQEAVQRALLAGYTTGEYVTGAASASVEISEPTATAGGRSLSVGTDLDYPAFWELGFHHAGNGQYYRVETWRPALEAAREAMEDAFNGAALSVLLQGAE